MGLDDETKATRVDETDLGHVQVDVVPVAEFRERIGQRHCSMSVDLPAERDRAALTGQFETLGEFGHAKKGYQPHSVRPRAGLAPDSIGQMVHLRTRRPVSMKETTSPITVSLVNDYELVVAGLATMLQPYADRVRVVDSTSDGSPAETADVALFDTFGGRRHALTKATELLREGRVRHVVLYTWDASADFLSSAQDAGVSGVILKSSPADRLVQSIERIVAGERLGLGHVTRSPRTEQNEELSTREREVLALLALGYTNRQIATELYLSVDTVKSHMRRLYSKLGVTNRTQAALRADRYQLRPPLSRVS